MNHQRATIIDHNSQITSLCNLEKLESFSPSLPDCSIQNKAVILKLKKNPESVSPKSTKLQSLLPKSLSSSVLTDTHNELFEIPLDGDSDVQNDTLTLGFSGGTTSLITNQSKSLTESKDNTPLINTEFRETSGNSETVEALLRHYSNGSNISVEQGKDLQNQEIPKNFDNDGSINFQNLEESLVPETLLNTINSNTLSMQEKHAHISNQNIDYETNKSNTDQKVVKKSKIEAYVKMVVCRKITIQKVLAETGQVLETKVKNEEEEPVTLDVDCVETTEDILKDSELLFDNTSELAASKWTSLDGGLKFLSTVSESRQKIGKNLLQEKILESSLKKVYNISKMIESASHKGHSPPHLSGDYNIDICSKKDDDVPVKTEHITDSDNDEWNEDVNDDSEDYLPSGHLKKNYKIQHSDKSNLEQCDKTVQNESQEDSIKLIPKRRGRKRKWDNALGISSNLRSCVFCNKHFNSTASCSEHMKMGNCISSLFCFICSKPFNNENELEKHLSAHCNERKPKVYECVDCYRSYRTRAGYEKHFRMGTCLKRDDLEDSFTGPLQCDLCPSRFSTQAYLRLHRYKVHENPKDTHTCLDCGKKFYSSIGYNKHKNGRPCTEPLKCWVCGKTYSSKAKESFKIHMKHHKSEVGGITFNCDECGRGYMTQMALTKHKLSHTGVKPYKCETCGKAFAMRYMVKDHARTHTGERPYLCSLCGNAFSNKGHLGRHLRSHENRTLQKKGRPKKIRGSEASENHETELKIIDLGQTLQGLDAQSIQVVNSQMFDSHVSGAPMIIQTNDNTIIIADGWPPSSIVTPAISLTNA